VGRLHVVPFRQARRAGECLVHSRLLPACMQELDFNSLQSRLQRSLEWVACRRGGSVVCRNDFESIARDEERGQRTRWNSCKTRQHFAGRLTLPRIGPLAGAARSFWQLGLASIFLVASWGALPLATVAQEPSCPKPADYKYLRYDEDYQYLRDPACKTEALDSIKFVPLNAAGTWYASFGGELRETIEHFNNPTWGQAPQGPAYTLQRYMEHADFHAGPRVRFYLEFKSGLEDGRAGGPRLIDLDRFDVNQGFLDVTLAQRAKGSVILRMGRQELGYGANRWVSIREGPTVHQTFDGFKLILNAGDWRVDAFATKFVETNGGVLDDATDPGRAFWGVYATHPFAPLAGGHLDLYYLGLEHSVAQFNQGKGRELRHSLGTRLWGKSDDGWDYDLEPVFQFGSFNSSMARGNILAWAAETSTGHTLRSARTTPRIGLEADIASGDKDPNNPDLQTFNPLFPRGLYNQIINLSGHTNFMELQPSLTLHLARGLTLAPDWQFIWRQSLNDGVYGVGGNLLRPAGSSTARYLGSQADFVANWRVTRHVTLVAIYGHFFTGPFLEQTGPGRPVNYVTGWFGYKF
jgi:Alginate export